MAERTNDSGYTIISLTRSEMVELVANLVTTLAQTPLPGQQFAAPAITIIDRGVTAERIVFDLKVI
jgi:hypothetical protein